MPYEELSKFTTLLIPTASRLAHEFYPNIWPNPDALRTANTISTQTEQERVAQMLDIIEKKTGGKRVLFIVDEVGHHLRNNESLISNLDGLAKNLKEIGQGKAWLVATAQETLPKTGPLFGLKDRFPIKIDLKPSDIREITHKRLLKKSSDGATTLKQHFSEKLVHLTQLEDYRTERALDEGSFVEFYPLLPQQFDVLIDAIRSLARLQGGIGLRSGIRCVQDILIGANPGEPAIVDRAVPSLVTVADLYEVLQPDIAPISKDAVLAVDRIAQSYGVDSWEHRIAKAIALLQQIDGFPITRHNLAALLYPEVGADAIADEVEAAVAKLLEDRLVPIGEAEGTLGFLSEAVSKIDKDRANIVVTTTQRLAVQSRLLRELFQKTPRVVIEGAKSVDAGISLFDGGREQKITEKDTDIRFLIQFVQDANLENTKAELVTESLATTNRNKIYIAGPQVNEIDDLLTDMVRAEEIRKQHLNDTDPEVQRYVSGQEHLVVTKAAEVQQFLTNALMKGWMIFNGNPSSAANLGSDREAAMKAQLAIAASDVFNKFKHAAENVASKTAENFLRVSDLTQITSERDPLSVVKIQGTETHIDLSHPALIEITDFLDRHSNPDGKRLLNEFARPPFGWSKDTTRYMAAALFYAQRIKIRTNAQEVKVVGDLAFAAFKSNSAFNGVTILPNSSEVPTDVRQRAATRLADLTGESFPALPQKIAEVAVKHLPQFVREFTNLPARASGLGLPTERFTHLQTGLTDALLGDGSDAPVIFGSQESNLYDNLIWARKLIKALDHGAEDTLRKISAILGDAERVAAQGILEDLPQSLNDAGAETLATVKDGNFFDDLPALTHTLEQMEQMVKSRCDEQVGTMRDAFEAQVTSLRESSDYQALDAGQRASTDQNLGNLVFDCQPDLNGLLSASVTLNRLTNDLQSIRASVQEANKPQPSPDPDPDPSPESEPKTDLATTVVLNAEIATEQDLDEAIEALTAERGKTPIRICLK